MIQKESKVNIIDNSGAKVGKVLKVLKWSEGKVGSLGDKVSLAIQKAQPRADISEWDIATGVIVRTRKEVGREDGSYIRFEDNAVVLIDSLGMPVGKRVFGPVAREIREKYKPITNLAQEVV